MHRCLKKRWRPQHNFRQPVHSPTLSCCVCFSTAWEELDTGTEHFLPWIICKKWWTTFLTILILHRLVLTSWKGRQDDDYCSLNFSLCAAAQFYVTAYLTLTVYIAYYKPKKKLQGWIVSCQESLFTVPKPVLSNSTAEWAATVKNIFSN